MHEVIASIGSRNEDTKIRRYECEIRRCKSSASAATDVQVAVCAYTIDSSFARERRAKPSQSPYLPEMIRFESAVSHDNRTHSSGRLRAP